MNARDELALVLANAQRFRNGSSALPSADHVSRLALDDADAVLAAGYSKPRTITTVEELDALHAKAVILDPNGTPWVCDGDVVEPWASVCEDPFGGPIWKNSRDIALPATVIHEP